MPGRLAAQINGSLDGMIFGRKAYEPLSAYWPTAAANPDASVRHLEAATLMHEIPKYVVSTTLSGSDWNNTDVISGDVRTAVHGRMARRPLTLVTMRTFRSGAIVLTHQPAHANQGNDPEGTEHEQ
jgi:hypothetical protein